jgi:trans-aconitate methyltransferase
MTDWTDKTWFEHCYHPHRDILLDKIKAFNPKSVYEFGCGYGQNLYRIKKELPDCRVVGSDTDKFRVETGLNRFTKEGVAVEMSIGNILTDTPDKKYDVVFTDAVFLMIEMDNDKLMEVMKKLLDMATKALILVEWHDDTSKFPGENTAQQIRVVRNYKEILLMLGIQRADFQKTTQEDFPSTPWEKWGYYMVIKK